MEKGTGMSTHQMEVFLGQLQAWPVVLMHLRTKEAQLSLG